MIDMEGAQKRYERRIKNQRKNRSNWTLFHIVKSDKSKNDYLKFKYEPLKQTAMKSHRVGGKTTKKRK